MADAGADASDQSDLSRTRAVRACGGAAAHPHPQPHGVRGILPGRARRRRHGPRPRQRRAHFDLLPISRRLRRRTLGRPPRHGRGAVRHSGRPARAIDLFPRAHAQEPAARQAGVDVSGVQSAPLRHHDVDRRQGNLADPQFPLQRRARIRLHRPRLGDPLDPRRRPGIRIRGDFERGLDRPPACRRPLPERARVHLRRCRAPLDSACRLRHERGHRRRRQSGLDAGCRAERLGRARDARRLSGRTPADHRSGFEVCLQDVPGQLQAAPRNSGGNRAGQSRRRRRPRRDRQAGARSLHPAAMLRRAQLRIFLRRFADHRLRRRAASGLFDGTVHVDERSGMPGATLLAARRPFALRRSGKRLWVAAVRSVGGGGWSGRRGGEARLSAARPRHRRFR